MSDQSKHKGLGKLKFYCQLCSKQCRDANGLNNHKDSESHKAKARLFEADPDKFISEFSEQFESYFIDVLQDISRGDWYAASEAYKEVVKDPDHVHLNATRWKDLTEFLNHLAEQGIVRKRPRDRGGIEIQLIDREREERHNKQLRDEKRKLERASEKETEESEKRMRSAIEVLETDGSLVKQPSAPTELQRTDSSEKIKFSFKPMQLKR